VSPHGDVEYTKVPGRTSWMILSKAITMGGAGTRKGEMHQRKLFGTALAVLASFSICGALPGITANTAPLPEE